MMEERRRHHRRRKRKDKEGPRYYLLPGMGGRLYRQKQKVIIRWSVGAAIFAALLMVALMYFLNKPKNAFLPH